MINTVNVESIKFISIQTTTRTNVIIEKSIEIKAWNNMNELFFTIFMHKYAQYIYCLFVILHCHVFIQVYVYNDNQTTFCKVYMKDLYFWSIYISHEIISYYNCSFIYEKNRKLNNQ